MSSNTIMKNPQKEIEKITLADGTTVWYDENTGVCYSTDTSHRFTGSMSNKYECVLVELGTYNSETNTVDLLFPKEEA